MLSSHQTYTTTPRENTAHFIKKPKRTHRGEQALSLVRAPRNISSHFIPFHPIPSHHNTCGSHGHPPRHPAEKRPDRHPREVLCAAAAAVPVPPPLHRAADPDATAAADAAAPPSHPPRTARERRALLEAGEARGRLLDRPAAADASLRRFSASRLPATRPAEGRRRRRARGVGVLGLPDLENPFRSRAVGDEGGERREGKGEGGGRRARGGGTRTMRDYCSRPSSSSSHSGPTFISSSCKRVWGLLRESRPTLLQGALTRRQPRAVSNITSFAAKTKKCRPTLHWGWLACYSTAPTCTHHPHTHIHSPVGLLSYTHLRGWSGYFKERSLTEL